MYGNIAHTRTAGKSKPLLLELQTADDDSLENLMGIFFDQDAIIKCPWLALITIDAQINRAFDVLWQKRPLEPRREPRAPSTSKPRRFDGLDDIVFAILRAFANASYPPSALYDARDWLFGFPILDNKTGLNSVSLIMHSLELASRLHLPSYAS